MKKDILIIGASHSGKTKITNIILNKYLEYEPLRGDANLIAMQSVLTKHLRKKNGFCSIVEAVLDEKESVEYLYDLYEQIKIDLYDTNRNVIIDSYNLDIEEVVKCFGATCDIYCLGMPNENVKNLVTKIRTLSSDKDWTRCLGNRRLAIYCEDIIENSKRMKEECEKNNIKFFDMSGNRDEKIEEVLSVIEKNSISKN